MAASNDHESYFQAVSDILRTGHWLTDQVSAALKPFDVSEPQFNVLRLLEDAGERPLAQQEIQERMFQRTSNVGRIIDRLLARGLVSRSINPENRRKMDIALTADGRKFIRKAGRAVRDFHAQLQPNLNEQEARQLARLLQKFRA